MHAMIEKVMPLIEEYHEIQKKLADPDVYSNPKELAKYGKRSRELQPLVSKYDEYQRLQKVIQEGKTLGNDSELGQMARDEAEVARDRLAALEIEMKEFLIPKDPDDEKSVILEVRAGTGGEEAALFAAEQLRMYIKYSEKKGWTTEFLRKSDADAGGIKEAIVRIEGAGAYGDLKFESGVHRVQRIPATENKGRVHTSTTTVAILPEAEEVDLQVRTEDLRIDTFRASGAGGQHVNKTESAIRITHIPTGVVVECQTERSQLRNKTLAMSMLRSRLYKAEQKRLAKERGDMRSSQVGSGERSEKIRTYNFPQDRVTDHRMNENFSNIPALMEGELDDLIFALRKWDAESRMESLNKSK